VEGIMLNREDKQKIANMMDDLTETGIEIGKYDTLDRWNEGFARKVELNFLRLRDAILRIIEKT
jgi:hypothetical protein